MGLGVGDNVRVALQGGRSGKVQDVRPGQVLVQYDTGERSWVPDAQVRRRGLSLRPSERPPSAAPTKAESRASAVKRQAPNPYQAPRVPTFANTAAPPSDYKAILFSFEGRIGRMQYWVASALILLPFVVAGTLAAMLARSLGESILYMILVITVLISIPLFWASLAVSVKRWHDLDRSGWWVLVGLVPYVGGLISFVVLGFFRGSDGPNRFGDDPLGGPGF